MSQGWHFNLFSDFGLTQRPWPFWSQVRAARINERASQLSRGRQKLCRRIEKLRYIVESSRALVSSGREGRAALVNRHSESPLVYLLFTPKNWHHSLSSSALKPTLPLLQHLLNNLLSHDAGLRVQVNCLIAPVAAMDARHGTARHRLRRHASHARLLRRVR